jgi:hypothetical protein
MKTNSKWKWLLLLSVVIGVGGCTDYYGTYQAYGRPYYGVTVHMVTASRLTATGTPTLATAIPAVTATLTLATAIPAATATLTLATAIPAATATPMLATATATETKGIATAVAPEGNTATIKGIATAATKGTAMAETEGTTATTKGIATAATKGTATAITGYRKSKRYREDAANKWRLVQNFTTL